MMKYMSAASCFPSSGFVRGTDGGAVVYPQRRMGAGTARSEELARGARMEFKISCGESVEDFEIRADWELSDMENPEAYVRNYHDFAYISRDRRAWRLLAARSVSGSVSVFRLSLEKGVTYFCHYPAYGLAELESDLEKWRGLGFETGIYGHSEKGRPLYLVRAAENSPGKKNFVIVARNHAYETAGSYCCRGIMDFLCGGSDIAAYIRAGFNVTILPMTNPDGVEDGMSRLTGPDGADLNRFITRDDGAHKAYLEFLRREKPDFLINHHNWQSKFLDGMWCPNDFYAERIKPSIGGDFKTVSVWTTEKSTPVFDFEKGSVQDWLEMEFKSKCVTFELPWFGRTTQRMEDLGAESFKACAMAVKQEEVTK
jgi:hypothetical protein